MGAIFWHNEADIAILAHELQHHIDFFNGTFADHNPKKPFKRLAYYTLPTHVVSQIGLWHELINQNDLNIGFLGLVVISLALAVEQFSQYRNDPREKSAQASEKIVRDITY